MRMSRALLAATKPIPPAVYYTIDVYANPNSAGTAALSQNNPVLAGTEVTATAYASAGFLFLHWEDGTGTIVSYSASYTFTANQSGTLTAQFGFDFI
jgi:hypothetical protein